jgi:hypothetical protein
MKNITTKLFLSVLAFALQLGNVFVSREIAGRIGLLEFGSETASLTLVSIFLGMASGIAVAVMLVRSANRETSRKAIATLVFGLFPLLGVIANLLYSAYGPQVFPFSFLRPGTLEFGEWAFNSQVPAFWLGVVAGWAIRRN